MVDSHPLLSTLLVVLVAGCGAGAKDPAGDANVDAALDAARLDASTDGALQGLVDASIAVDSAFAFGDGGTVLCGDHICQCSNASDDDADGEVDGFDIECAGPLDDDESSFATGVPGDNRDGAWNDCYFDGDSGHGNDGCMQRVGCLTGEIPLDDPRCAVSDECLAICLPLTPNGCDCFGCCDYRVGDTIEHILTGSTCSEELLADTTACPRCTPNEECVNPCGECELCQGKTIADLPSTCFHSDAGVPDLCADGVASCAASADCAADQTCFGGCCQSVIF